MVDLIVFIIDESMSCIIDGWSKVVVSFGVVSERLSERETEGFASNCWESQEMKKESSSTSRFLFDLVDVAPRLLGWLLGWLVANVLLYDTLDTVLVSMLIQLTLVQMNGYMDR